MNVFVKEKDCWGCGLCSETCGTVFRIGDNDKSQVYAVPTEEEEATVRQLAEECPPKAISFW